MSRMRARKDKVVKWQELVLFELLLILCLIAGTVLSELCRASLVLNFKARPLVEILIGDKFEIQAEVEAKNDKW